MKIMIVGSGGMLARELGKNRVEGGVGLVELPEPEQLGD